MQRVLETLTVDVKRCRDAILRPTASTDAVYAHVARGVPFRDAYSDVGADPENAFDGDPADSWRARKHLGAPGDSAPSEVTARINRGLDWVAKCTKAHARVRRSVLGA